MAANNNIADTLNNRLHIAKNACVSVTKSVIENLQIDTKIRLNYYNALITTILLYNTHIHNVNDTALENAILSLQLHTIHRLGNMETIRLFSQSYNYEENPFSQL